MVAIAQLPSILTHQTRRLPIKSINKIQFQTARPNKTYSPDIGNRAERTDAKPWPNCRHTAALNATLLSVLGFLALAVGFAMVARLEERFLRQQLGEQIYEGYAARVPMLAPTWSRGSRSRA